MAKHQRGSILIITILVMFVGAIIMAALFSSLTTSLSASSASEERSFTYYAADSGVEDAYFWLQQDQELAGWTETEEEQWEREPYTINGRTVAVNVEDTGNQTYRVTSTATTESSADTTIESYVASFTEDVLSPFGGSAISSNTSVRLMSDSDVAGNISVPGGDESRVDIDPSATHNGSIIPLSAPWPTAEVFSEMFWDDVDDLEPYAWYLIDVDFTPNIGPLYRDGNLEIWSTVKDMSYASLNGTVYVTGDLEIAPTGRDFTLNLNGQTIFVEGYIDVKDTCTIEGTGAIIALGDIFFGPKTNSCVGDFLFIMSIEGGVKLNPNGDIYGSVSGHDEVKVQPDALVTWIDLGSVEYELPVMDALEILTYNIIQ